MTAYIDFSTGRPPARHHRPQRAVAVPGKRSWWATDGQCALWVALGANLGCCGCYSSMFQVGLPPVRGGYFDVRIRGFDSRPGSAGHLCRAPRLRPVLAACGKPDRPAWMGSASAGHAQLAPEPGPDDLLALANAVREAASAAPEAPVRHNHAHMEPPAGTEGTRRGHLRILREPS